MTTEQRTEAQIRYLVEDLGDDPDDARLRVRDEDLWITHFSTRYAFEDTQETVKLWEDAFELAEELAQLAVNLYDVKQSAIVQLASDARERAREAARRARERANVS